MAAPKLEIEVVVQADDKEALQRGLREAADALDMPWQASDDGKTLDAKFHINHGWAYEVTNFDPLKPVKGA